MMPVFASSLQALLESSGFKVRDHESASGVLSDPELRQAWCLIADIRMPGMDGLQLQEELTARKIDVPVIVVTGHGDVPLAVRAMKAGAIDFLEKPFDEELLLAAVRRASGVAEHAREISQMAGRASRLIAGLTPREQDVLNGGAEFKVVLPPAGI